MHLFLLLILPATAAFGQIDPAHCRYALGMEDGRITDHDITASSQWYETTGPQYARTPCLHSALSVTGCTRGVTWRDTAGPFSCSSQNHHGSW